MARYNAKESEKHWQSVWDARGAFATPDDSKAQDPSKPKCYVLEMFPYPSGRIHMGHARNYTMGDVIARFRRAQGYNVPASDGLGWPSVCRRKMRRATRASIRATGLTKNIAAMRSELKRMGLSIDWSREFATCDPAYYHQQQKLFLQFYQAGFVYRGEADVNWDPVDMTVLANEQVIDGRGWRSGALVERRKLSQWSFKITAFAEELLTALDTLDRWPEKVRTMQKNWIGRSEGLGFQFALSDGGQAGCLHDAARHAVRRVLCGAVAGTSLDPGTGEERSETGGVHSWNAARPAPPKRKSRKPKSWVTIPALPPRILSIRTGSCP